MILAGRVGDRRLQLQRLNSNSALRTSTSEIIEEYP
jgi:hypothetical protein